MDRWEPYIQATRARVPEAAEKIVFDHFHVMGHSGKAVDTVRKQEHRDLMASGWKFWNRWYFWATHSRLEPIRKAAETVRQHIDNILTYARVPSCFGEHGLPDPNQEKPEE